MFLSKSKTGQSVLEYIALIVIVIVSIIIIQTYVTRGFSGRWKDVGDSFGYGRQFDPNRTHECDFDYQFTNRWYSPSCFENHNPPGDCLTLAVSCGTSECRENWEQRCKGAIEDCVLKETREGVCNKDWCDEDEDCGPDGRCLNFQCVSKE